MCVSEQNLRGNAPKLKLSEAGICKVGTVLNAQRLTAAFLAKRSACPAILVDAVLPNSPHQGTSMNTFNIKMITLALGVAFSAGAMAENMSKTDYKAGKDKIAAEYKTGKAACASLAGNVKDICTADAKGKEKVALAELEASYKPSNKTRYEARAAKAEADYAVANERCDDKAGNEKDVCVKEAKAVETTAKADAKAQMKTSDANATANKKTAEARNKASEKSADARKGATEDKVDAQYAVAKEKCDSYSGNAKDNCITQAKASAGK
jgi:hypothetical protein